MKTALTLAVFVALIASRAHAQAGTDLKPGGPGTEPVDVTRLDVARLPPEAATVTRELYDTGFFLEGQVGAATFVGDVRNVSRAGPRLAIAFGYELTRWFALVVQAEGSMHTTKNRPPPAHTSYELVSGAAAARFSIPFHARYAIWASGLFGGAWSSGDVLRALGFRSAAKLGMLYGGELGFDWHMRARHHSLGLLAGGRMLPNLDRDDSAVSLYGSAYLRYVF